MKENCSLSQPTKTMLFSNIAFNPFPSFRSKCFSGFPNPPRCSPHGIPLWTDDVSGIPPEFVHDCSHTCLRAVLVVSAIQLPATILVGETGVLVQFQHLAMTIVDGQNQLWTVYFYRKQDWQPQGNLAKRRRFN